VSSREIVSIKYEMLKEIDMKGENLYPEKTTTNKILSLDKDITAVTRVSNSDLVVATGNKLHIVQLEKSIHDQKPCDGNMLEEWCPEKLNEDTVITKIACTQGPQPTLLSVVTSNNEIYTYQRKDDTLVDTQSLSNDILDIKFINDDRDLLIVTKDGPKLLPNFEESLASEKSNAKTF